METISTVGDEDLDGVIEQIERSCGQDDALAESLWDAGSTASRRVAVALADPAAATIQKLERWSRECSLPAHSKALAGLAARSVHGRMLMDAWIRTSFDSVASAGWWALGEIAGQKVHLPDGYFQPLLALLEQRIQFESEWIRGAMLEGAAGVAGRTTGLARATVGMLHRIEERTKDDPALLAAVQASIAEIEAMRIRRGLWSGPPPRDGD